MRSTVGDEPMWPYFNSGLVMVPRGLAIKLQTKWIQLALELRDRDLLGTDTHPWCVVVPPSSVATTTQRALCGGGELERSVLRWDVYAGLNIVLLR
jgi:hypothetical protein